MKSSHGISSICGVTKTFLIREWKNAHGRERNPELPMQNVPAVGQQVIGGGVCFEGKN